MKRIIVLTLSLLLSSLSYSALHIRDLDGDWSNGHEGVYDDVLDITWMADANAALAFYGADGLELFSAFQPPPYLRDGRGFLGSGVTSAMNNYNEGNGYLGVNVWRAPHYAPVGGSEGYLEGEMSHLANITLGGGDCLYNKTGCLDETALNNQSLFVNLGFYHWTDSGDASSFYGNSCHMSRCSVVQIGVSQQVVFNVQQYYTFWAVADGDFGTPSPVEKKLTVSDGAAEDWFGWNVSVSGDTAVIGAERDGDNGFASGSAYVYVRSNGVWSEQAKLTASDAAAGDKFGYSVSVSGDTVVIGAVLDEDDGSASGSAYVYVRSNGVWSEQAKLTASDRATGDQFGYSVSVAGDTAAIGARLDDDNGSASGSAYVYVRSNGVWSEQQKLTASDAAGSDNFGYSASVAGNTAVIGADRDDDDGVDSGSAYVYVRSNGVWSEQQKLTASDAAAGDQFGYSASVSNDTAVIGAWVDDDNGVDSGSAYVYVRSNGVWSEQQKLTASDGAAGDQFGFSVSVSGDTAVIGAVLDDDNGVDSGSAYVYARGNGMWIEQQKLTASDGAAGDQFGISVSVSGDTAVIGAYLDDDNGADSGSASIVDLDADDDGLLNAAELVLGTNRFDADTDGDGFADGAEVGNGYDPLVNDADNDGLSASLEETLGTNPLLADTDGDGLPDGYEVANGSNPLIADTSTKNVPAMGGFGILLMCLSMLGLGAVRLRGN